MTMTRNFLAASCSTTDYWNRTAWCGVRQSGRGRFIHPLNFQMFGSWFILGLAKNVNESSLCTTEMMKMKTQGRGGTVVQLQQYV